MTDVFPLHSSEKRQLVDEVETLRLKVDDLNQKYVWKQLALWSLFFDISPYRLAQQSADFENALEKSTSPSNDVDFFEAEAVKAREIDPMLLCLNDLDAFNMRFRFFFYEGSDSSN